jgi:hypothetical protein
MDASARIRRILWGTLRGTVPAPRALDMMVRWEAHFAPDFERDPASALTSFLLEELGGNLKRSDCSALADRILAIMDDFSGPLPQDPIASIRRLSEARLSAQPAPAAAPVEVRAELPPAMDPTPEVVNAPEAESLASVGSVEQSPPAPALNDPLPIAETMLAEPVLAEPVLADPVLAEPVLAEPVWAKSVTSVAHEWRGDDLIDRASAGEAAIRLDADHAEAEPIEYAEPGRRYDHANVIDHELFVDKDLTHGPGTAWSEAPDPVTMAPNAIITAPDGRVLSSGDEVDAAYYEMALRVPRGFESARTLEILPPADEPDLRADDGAELGADWDADWNSDPAWNADPKPAPKSDMSERPLDDTDIPPPPRSPTADPSAPYGIDRSVFSRIFLEHD